MTWFLFIHPALQARTQAIHRYIVRSRKYCWTYELSLGSCNVRQQENDLDLLLVLKPAGLLLFVSNTLISLRRPLAHPFHCLRISRYHATVAPDLILLVLNVRCRALGRCGSLVLKDNDILIFAEESINILKGTRRCLGIKKIYYRNERGVEDCPDDIEFPPKGLNPSGSYLNDFIVLTLAAFQRTCQGTNIPMKLKIQLEAVPE